MIISRVSIGEARRRRLVGLGAQTTGRVVRSGWLCFFVSLQSCEHTGRTTISLSEPVCFFLVENGLFKLCNSSFCSRSKLKYRGCVKKRRLDRHCEVSSCFCLFGCTLAVVSPFLTYSVVFLPVGKLLCPISIVRKVNFIVTDALEWLTFSRVPQLPLTRRPGPQLHQDGVSRGRRIGGRRRERSSQVNSTTFSLHSPRGVPISAH